MTGATEIKVCKFTRDGMDLAKRYLKSLRDSGWTEPFRGMLSDPRYAEPVEPEAYVESRAFANRREAGQYLAEQLMPLAGAGLAHDPDVWSWLGIFYLEKVFRHDEQHVRRIKEFSEAAYLIDLVDRDSRDRSHHRLLIAYDVWTRCGEKAWFLLDEVVSSMSQFTLRLVQAPEVFRSEGVMELAHRLYADRETGRLRSGSLGMSNATAPPGSLPRLLAVLTQFSMTYDVYGMEADRLLRLLPPEFDRFRAVAAPTPR